MRTFTDILAPFSDSELIQLRGILSETDPEGVLLQFINQELDIRNYYTEGDLQ